MLLIASTVSLPQCSSHFLYLVSRIFEAARLATESIGIVFYLPRVVRHSRRSRLFAQGEGAGALMQDCLSYRSFAAGQSITLPSLRSLAPRIDARMSSESNAFLFSNLIIPSGSPSFFMPDPLQYEVQ
jgi:hypothetical protein